MDPSISINREFQEAKEKFFPEQRIEAVTMADATEIARQFFPRKES